MKKLGFLRSPQKTEFTVGEQIAKRDLLVKLEDEKGNFELIRDFEIIPDRPLSKQDTEVTIQYQDLQLSFPVTVKDKILKAAALNSMPNKTEYIAGVNALDVSGGTLALVYSDGTASQIEMTPDMVRGFDPDKSGKQIVYIHYEGFEIPMQISIKPRTLMQVQVKQQPTKRDYIEGEMLNVAGLVLEAVYNNGDTEEIHDYPDPGIKVQQGQAVVQLPYDGMTFPVFIHVKEYTVTGIEMAQLPDKTSYLEQSDALDVSGGLVAKLLSNGEREVVPLTPNMASGFSNQQAGICSIIVNLEGFQCGFDVQIIEKEIDRIEIVHQPAKTVYFEGDSFEPEGLVLKAIYNNHTTERIIDFKIEPETLRQGMPHVIAEYQGKTVEIPIHVQQRMIESISIATLPEKLKYKENQEMLDVSGGKLLVLYQNGTAETVDMLPGMVEGFDHTIPGENELTVRYQGKTASYSVTIIPKMLLGIMIAAQPKKTIYHPGELFEPEGIKVVGLYEDSSMTEIRHFAFQPEGALSLNDAAVIISYMDKLAVVPITVTDEIEENAAESVYQDMPTEEILPEPDTFLLAAKTQEENLPLPTEEIQTQKENLPLPTKEIESKENMQPLSSPTKRRFYAGTMTLRFKDDENARLFR